MKERTKGNLLNLLNLILLVFCLGMLLLLLIQCVPLEEDTDDPLKRYPPPKNPESDTNKDWDDLMERLRYRPPIEQGQHLLPGQELRRQDVPLPPDTAGALGERLRRHQMLQSGVYDLMQRILDGTAIVSPTQVVK